MWAAEARVPRPTPVRPYDPRIPAYATAVAAARRAAALRWIPLGTPEREALHTLAEEHFVFIVGKPGDRSMALQEERCLPWHCRGVRIALTLAQGRVAEVSADDVTMEYDY